PLPQPSPPYALSLHGALPISGFDARISALQEVSAGQTAIVGMCTSGSFNVLGNDGRCSIIGREIGFENVGVDANIFKADLTADEDRKSTRLNSSHVSISYAVS